MTGGIKYRLSPTERQLFRDSAGIFQSVLQRLEAKGVRLQWTDPELSVTAEETEKGTRFFIVYPLDNDQRANTGRVYLQDEFILASTDQRLLSFIRSFRQDVEHDHQIPFWSELAKFDHPGLEFPDKKGHLQQFLSDLQNIPLPSQTDPVFQEFQEKVLKNLRRPFPANFKESLHQNQDVYNEVFSILKPLGVKMKFGDSQSGVVLRREGNRLFLKVVIVVDDDVGTDALSREYARIYLTDNFVIDADTHTVLSFKREYSTTSDLNNARLSQAITELRDSSTPPVDDPQLQGLARGVLKGLGLAKKSAGQDGVWKLNYPKLREEAKTPDERLLVELLVWADPMPEVPSPVPPGNASIPVAVRRPESLAREVLHQALGQVVRRRGEAGEEIRRLAKQPEIGGEIRSALEALAFLAEDRLEEARTALRSLPTKGHLKNHLERVVELKIRRQTALWGLPILKAAALEKLDKVRKEDRAWFLPASGDSDTRDPAQRRKVLENHFLRVESYLRAHPVSLEEAFQAIASQGPYESFLSREVWEDPSIQKLRALLTEPDRTFREEALVTLARVEFLAREPWPQTSAAILQALSSETAGREDLQRWVGGRATLAQKLEILFPHLAGEVSSPRMLASMGLAGSLASFGKFAVLGRFGYQTSALRWGAEGAAILLEAPTFVLSEKLLASAFGSPEGQWDRFGPDLLGAYLAFGTLRLAGRGSTRLNRHLEKNYFDPTLKAEAFADRRFASHFFRAANFRPWVPGMIQGGVHHAGSIGSLLLANSLARALHLRTASPQGWKSDLTDDLMMYGQFILAGNLAERIRPHLGLDPWEPYLKAMEAAPLQAPAPVQPGRIHRFREAWKERGGVRGQLQRIREHFADRGWLRKNDSPTTETNSTHVTSSAAETNLAAAEASSVPETNLAAAEASSVPETSPSTLETNIETNSRTEANAVSETSSSVEASSDPVETKPTAPVPGEPPAQAREPQAFLRPKKIPLSFPRLEETQDLFQQEWILGCDPILTEQLAIPNHISFISANSQVKARHAKITLKVTAEPEQKGEKKEEAAGKKAGPEEEKPERKTSIEYSIEPLEGNTFLNQIGLLPGPIPLKLGDVIQLGENGKKITFQMDATNQAGFLQEAPIPLEPEKQEWILGRQSKKSASLDVSVPSSERQVSRLHARIIQDESGNYFIQDLSTEGLFVDDYRVYGIKPLYHQSRIQLGGEQDQGELQLFWFENPKAVRTQRKVGDPPYFPKKLLPPMQAEVHPLYRGRSWDEVEAYVAALREKTEAERSAEKILESSGLSDENLEAAGLTPEQPTRPSVLLARLKFSTGLELELHSDKTGFIFGSRPHQAEDPPFTAPIELLDAPGLAGRHARLYLDSRGRFVLEDLGSEEGVYVHDRTFWNAAKVILDAQTNQKKEEAEKKWREIPKTLPNLQRIANWTFLREGERVFLGMGLHFDFWPQTLTHGYQEPPGLKGEWELPKPTPEPDKE